MKAWSKEGKFRPDLYYRLSVFTIHLPPLRERGADDFLLLVQIYLQRFSQELGREVRDIAPDALAQMRGYGWPGNIRELQSVLKQALLKATGPTLLPAFLPAEMTPKNQIGTAAKTLRSLGAGTTLGDLEHAAVQQCLIQTGGNRQQTAALLGISTRTLLRKIRKYGLEDPLRPAEDAGDAVSSVN